MPEIERGFIVSGCAGLVLGKRRRRGPEEEPCAIFRKGEGGGIGNHEPSPKALRFHRSDRCCLRCFAIPEIELVLGLFGCGIVMAAYESEFVLLVVPSEFLVLALAGEQRFRCIGAFGGNYVNAIRVVFGRSDGIAYGSAVFGHYIFKYIRQRPFRCGIKTANHQICTECRLARCGTGSRCFAVSHYRLALIWNAEVFHARHASGSRCSQVEDHQITRGQICACCRAAG